MLSIAIDANAVVNLSPVLVRVFDHAPRVEALTVNARVHSMPKAPRPLPMLRRLDLVLHHWQAPPKFVLFSDVPQLRTATFNDNAALGVSLPWSQLTSVTLKQFYPDECAPVLQQTFNLQHCELSLVDGGNSGLPETSLPHLTVLTLAGYDRCGPVTEYLDTLVVPALRTLQVPELFLGADPIDTLTSFIDKSGCKLQELCITGKIYAKDLNRYRPAFPLIQTLSVRGWCPSGIPGAQEWKLPKSMSCTISDHSPSTVHSR